MVNDSGRPDPTAPEAQQVPVESLPEEALVFRTGEPVLRQ